jgi:formiminotetrahydrofolate cyclodeaminase
MSVSPPIPPSEPPTDLAPAPGAGMGLIGASLASGPPGPGVGEVTGGVIAVAAGLCESIARASLASWPDGRGVVAQAAELRRRAETLAGENAVAYGKVRTALHPQQQATTGRDATLRATLLRSAEIPLALATTAADCAILAAAIAHHAHPDCRADAIGAAELATGAARSAAWLVEINLALLPDDPYRVEARAVVAAAEAARESARDEA